jgi:outer membrane protein OmpA-like peptidoglycan-associated protein
MSRISLLSIFSFFIFLSGWSQSVNTSDLGALVEQLNTRYDEQNPVLSPDGSRLYFTRANDSLNIGGSRDKGDIWMSTLGEDGRWNSPVNIGAPINNDLRNYLLGFSPDGKIMFLNNEKRNPGGLIINDGISYSVNTNGQWSRPARVSVDYLLNKSSHQSGSISADGSIMLLSLQSYASRGEEDIYICTYQDGKWTQPVNLGSTINTSHQEMTPYLSPDKKNLYFSSNGHGGKGGRDIFVSERTGDGWKDWSKPRNLGPEVNSLGVELNYFIDARNNIAYFSSTQNSDGYGDIRAHDITIEIEENPVQEEVFQELVEVAEEESKVLVLSGKIKNAKTTDPLAAAINVVNADFDQSINSSQEDGSYAIEIPRKANSIVVSVKSPGFMSLKQEITLNEADLSQDFELEPLEIGATFTLNKVYFERGTSTLLEESFEELEGVVEMMNENPEVKIELSGHTDNQGSSKLNIKLSQERVDVVELYLTEHGIDNKRIKGKGYGGTRPVASNASEETRKLNRRVEITILKN